jgi:hypothetical protein
LGNAETNILILSASTGNNVEGNVTEPVCVANEDDMTCVQKKGSLDFKREQKLNQTYFRWVPEMNSPDLSNNYAFQIICYDKKPNEILSYNDTFVLLFQGNTIGEGYGFENNTKSGLIKKASTNIHFKFVPGFKGKYCEDNTCKKIDLSQIKTNENLTGTYKSYPVYRDCMGECVDNEYIAKKTDMFNSILIIFLILIVMVLIYLIIIKFLKKKKNI